MVKDWAYYSLEALVMQAEFSVSKEDKKLIRETLPDHSNF